MAASRIGGGPPVGRADSNNILYVAAAGCPIGAPEAGLAGMRV